MHHDQARHGASRVYVYSARFWHHAVRFVLVFSYQVSSTITTAKLFLLFDDVARDERKLLFYPLLVREDLKQR